MKGKPGIPKGVWVLGFVSLLMDVSSEMIHSLLPVYLVAGLGASTLVVGIIEGTAEATAMVAKVFSGALSDRWRKRKWLVLAGYGLGAISKPLFALATTPALVFGARFMDRIGKGIRGAPRDALIADLAPKEVRGAAFGLRQTLDTVGAFAGPLIAIALMLAWANDFQAVFWVAAIPAALCVLLIIFGVREPERAAGSAAASVPLSLALLKSMGRPYWRVVALGALLTLARFSEAFLVLRAADLGLAVAWTPLVLVAMSVVFAFSAYPAGVLADRMSHTQLLGWGVAALIVADLLLACAGSLVLAGVGIAFWGLHMGLTQGLLATMVADVAPKDLRGTAFGFFNLMSGLAMLLASTLAGALWHFSGPAATFSASALLACASLAAIASIRR
jgi:MFS family permease